jgi:glycosyltransferase involved in cell wall biosynthesis
VRVLIWHGWLLEGSGSNVYTARLAEVLAGEGHDVLLLCQEGHPERYPWIDAWGTVGPGGVSIVGSSEGSHAGRCVLLRPEIGRMLPVFVADEYEGFEVTTFVDLDADELERYLDRNVDALRAAADWHRSDAVISGHAVPGAVVARRALGPGSFVAKIHGSDIEYAMRAQTRYLELAREGLTAARVVVGASSDVIRRCLELVPGIDRVATVPPGVEVHAFRPRPRVEALLEVATRLDRDPEASAGRPSAVDDDVGRAMAARDARALDDLAHAYDQRVPDPDAADRLRELASTSDPIVGYFGKLIPQKGVELAMAAARLSGHRPASLIVGFGLHREWLTALDIALRTSDADALAWLRDPGGLPIEPSAGELAAGSGPTIFTGRLDHRYAPSALAAMDVLLVPSILEEAFGMVAIEGAAAGALPLVARHSGLAEVASALEDAADRPGLFSFQPGPGATSRIAVGIDRLLSLPKEERDRLRAEINEFVAREWSWQRTASRLLHAASDS